MKKGLVITVIIAIVAILITGIILNKYRIVLQEKQKADKQTEELFSLTDDNFDEIVKFPSSKVKPDVDNMQITLNLPEDKKLNHDAPFSLVVKSNDDKIARVISRELTEGSKTLIVPLSLNEGSTTIFGIMDFSFCGKIDQSLCFFQKVKFEIPVEVTQEGDSKFEIEYKVK